MKKIIITIGAFLICAGISQAEVRKNLDMSMTAGAPVHAALSVVLASTSTTAAVSKGVQRFITNHSDYTIYKVNGNYTVAITTSTGTPIYSKEHYIEDRWFDAMWFAADPAASTNTCDVRIETQVWQ